MDTTRTEKSATAAIEEYLEYRRIVGEDDGGRLFTPEEYEDYKKEVLPTRLQNRLYVSFGVPGGMDCKLIGPETPCFCTHRGCRCTSYCYVPLSGSQPIRCRCKHSACDHSEAVGHLCRKCATCSGFRSPYTCGCGQPSFAHETLVETKEERMARGRPVGRDIPYVAMGGLTGFSSLVDGYLRLDSSGRGAVPHSDSEPTSSGPSLEHVFEKECAPSPRVVGGDTCGSQQSGVTGDSSDVKCLSKQLSSLKTSEQEDMAYFEKRYRERLKMEKAAKQTSSSAKAKPRNTSAKSKLA